MDYNSDIPGLVYGAMTYLDIMYATYEDLYK